VGAREPIRRLVADTDDRSRLVPSLALVHVAGDESLQLGVAGQATLDQK
jgi:hypothetical protein